MSLTAGPKCLEYAAYRGYSASLLTRVPERYSGLVSSDVSVLPCDTNDLTSLLEAVRTLHRQRPINGVTTTHDLYTPHVAAVAEALGLPGLSVAAVTTVRNKYKMRLALQAHAPDLTVPFALVQSGDEALKVATSIGYPLVAKPQDGNNSWNVRRIDSSAELAEYMGRVPHWGKNTAGQSFASGVLLEKCLGGSEHAVDTAQHAGGSITRLSVSGKDVTGADGRYFAEVGDYFPLVGSVPDLLFAEVSRALTELEIDCGVIHTECRLDQGRVSIIEINPRITGDVTGSHLMEMAFGASAVQQVVEIALGHACPWRPTRQRGVGLFGISMPTSGYFGGIPNLRDVSDQPGVAFVHLLAEIGAQCNHPPRDNSDFVARVATEGETAEQAYDLAKTAAALAAVSVLPEPPTRGDAARPGA